MATALIARELSASQFGVLSLALSVAILIFTIGSLGLAELGSRDVAANRQGSALLIGQILTIRTLAVLVLLVITAAVFALAGWSIVVLIEVGMMSLAMSWNGDWLARAIDRVGLLGLGITIGGAVCLAATAMLYGVHRAGAALAAFVAGEFATAGFLWGVTLRKVPIRLGRDGIGSLLAQIPSVATAVIVVYGFYSGVDYFLIAAIGSTAAAGSYSAPYRIFLFTLNIATFAAYVLLPRLAAARPDPTAREALLDKVSANFGAYGLVVAGGCLLAARPALEVIFGGRYATPKTVDVLSDLGVASLLYLTAYPIGYVSLVTGSSREFMRGAVVTASTNVALDGILIPIIGIEGAAVATVVALALGAIVWTRWLSVSVLVRRVLVPAGAGCAAVVVARIVPELAPVAGALLVAGGVWLIAGHWRWMAGPQGADSDAAPGFRFGR